MSLKEQVYSVLLISAAEKFNRSIAALLPEGRYSPVHIADSAAAARRRVLEHSYDLILINTPLPDEFGNELALELCQNSGVGLLMFVRAEHYDDIFARVTEYGVLTVKKPTAAQTVVQSVRLLCATRQRLKRMEKKTATMEEKMAEIRLINRAKWQLIADTGMTEEQAHRYIEKQAMDRCITRRRVAQELLNEYQ